MKDIEAAVKAESQYRLLRQANTEVSLLEMLKPYGYISIDEYSKEKVDYTLKLSKVSIVTASSSAEAFPIIQNAFLTHTNTYAELGNVEPLFVWSGTDPYNEDRCKEDNVPVYNLGYSGGTIISGNSDYNMIFVLDQAIGAIGNYFLDRLFEYINRYESEVTLDNNDILISGKKVIGAAHVESGGMELYTTQATFVDHTQDINRYCVVPSSKPSGTFKAITKEQLRGEVLSWLQ